MQTDRLFITPLHENDHAFIKDLLNTEGWLQFIGDRNIHSTEDATAYIRKINNNSATHYQVARLKETAEPIGLVTIIKRDYLDQPDIGFAFLPAYSGKGYAFEASEAVMAHILENDTLRSVHAVTLPQNTSSIKLITKLGLGFDKTIHINEEALHVYTYQKKQEH